MEDHSRAGWSPWLLDRTVFIYFADGNGIPWASGAKKRTDGTRPAGENGTEYAQLVLKRAASRTDEAVEQLREECLQDLPAAVVTSTVLSMPSRWPCKAPSNLFGNRYLCCTKCLDRSKQSSLQSGQTKYTVERTRMRSKSLNCRVKSILKSRPG